MNLKTLLIIAILLLSAVSGFAQKRIPAAEAIMFLGNYQAASAPLGGSVSATPAGGTSGLSSATVTIPGVFAGTAVVSPSTGAVRITNASPAGAYNVTVKGYDNFGAVITKTFALTVAATSSCSTVNFGQAFDPIGSAFQTETADFNGDGKQDAVSVSNSESLIVVRYGLGNGSFGAQATYPVATFAGLIAVADINNDGKMDIAVVHTSPMRVSVMLGTVNGFATTVVSTISGFTNYQPRRIAAGKFNSDGFADLLITGSNGNTAIPFLAGSATGAMTVGGAIAIPNGVTSNDVITGDLNGDGRPDAAYLLDGQTNVYLALGSGSGFNLPTVRPLSATAVSLTAADFTGEGRPDVAVSTSGGTIEMLIDPGYTNNPPEVSSVPFANQMIAGDVNFDGRPEIITSSGYIYERTPNNNAFFQTQAFPQSSDVGNVTDIDLADMNGDGTRDIVASYANFSQPVTGRLAVYRRNVNNTGFDLAPVTQLDTTAPFAQPLTGDINNDGRPDLIFVTFESDNTVAVSAQTGNGQGGFGQGYRRVFNSSFVLPAIADFNGDGNLDIALMQNTALSILYGNGNGGFSLSNQTFQGLFMQRMIVAGDFNGDGRQDIAGFLASGFVNVLLRNAGNTGFNDPVIVGPPNPNEEGSMLITGDFNNDGIRDLAYTRQSAAKFTVIPDINAMAIDYPLQGNGSDLTAADLNGDGFQDLAVIIGNTIEMLPGNGAGGFGVSTQIPLQTFSSGITTSDINSDGRTDLVVTGQFNFTTGNNLSVFLRNTTNDGYQQPVFLRSVENNQSSANRPSVADLTGDGRPDIFVTNSGSTGFHAQYVVMPRFCSVELSLRGALPNAQAGQFYSQTLYATGGTGPYNFTVNGLPPGLIYTSDGQSVTISGSATTGGNVNVRVAVSDSLSFTRFRHESRLVPQESNSVAETLPLHINFGPTAAHVAVSGRLITANGAPVAQARVTLMADDGTHKTAVSNGFGYYSFDDVESGRTCLISVTSKRYSFEPRLVMIDGEIPALDLIANQ